MESGLQPLPEAISDPGAIGASRLKISTCFEPVRVVTLIFKLHQIEVEVFGPAENDAEAGRVHYDNAPEWLESWERFRSLAFPLENCSNLGIYDGTGYTHTICGPGFEKTVGWGNPTWVKQPQQKLVIRTYVELAEAAGLNRLIRMHRRWS